MAHNWIIYHVITILHILYGLDLTPKYILLKKKILSTLHNC